MNMRANCLNVALLLSVSGSSLLVVPARAAAQDRGPQMRVVEGKVTNADDSPARGAVVYLKDSKTLTVKSFIVQPDGTYRFGQLTPGVDYLLYAEVNGKQSKTKTLSSFDIKNQFVINLHIDK